MVTIECFWKESWEVILKMKPPPKTQMMTGAYRDVPWEFSRRRKLGHQEPNRHRAPTTNIEQNDPSCVDVCPGTQLPFWCGIRLQSICIFLCCSMTSKASIERLNICNWSFWVPQEECRVKPFQPFTRPKKCGAKSDPSQSLMYPELTTLLFLLVVTMIHTYSRILLTFTSSQVSILEFYKVPYFPVNGTHILKCFMPQFAFHPALFGSWSHFPSLATTSPFRCQIVLHFRECKL